METNRNVTNLPALPVPGLPVSAPKLDKLLHRAVRSSIKTRYPTDDNPTAPIVDYEVWEPPPLTHAIIDAAKCALPEWDAFMRQARIGHIGEADTIADWLSQLGILCASQKITVAEAKEKLAAYAGGLDYPQFCFTKKSLYAAARDFKWFPAFAEVCAWLNDYCAPAREMHDRIKALAKAQLKIAAPVPDAGGPLITDLPKAEREKYLADMAALRRRLESRGIGETKVASEARRRMDEVNERQRELLAPILEAKRRQLMETDEVVAGSSQDPA